MDGTGSGLKDTGASPQKQVSWPKRIKLIVAGVGLILLLIIVFQNTTSVESRILFMTITMPRALLLAVMALIGFVLGVFFSASWFRKMESGKSGKA